VNSSAVKSGLSLVLLGLNLYAAPAAQAQSKPGTSIAEIALYRGADRQQRLVEGAKNEGALVLYGSLPINNMTPVIEAFTKKYGIKVKSWRSGSKVVLQKVTSETLAGRFEVDIVENNSPEMEALHRFKMLERVISPLQAEIMPKATPAHKEWAAYATSVFVQAYNTDKIKKADLPKTYQDLLDPKWKGRLGIETNNYNWFATVMQELGQEKGEQLFKNIVDTNGVSVRKGHTLLAQMVASGEVPLALTVLSFSPQQLKEKGAPIESFIIAPVITEPRGIGVLRTTRHPHAALLFYDFMLSQEAQQILARNHVVPTSTKVDTPWTNLPLKFIDPAQSLDLSEKRIKTYEDTVTKRSK
jgi:iron(III) transport system substrate-binding protein